MCGMLLWGLGHKSEASLDSPFTSYHLGYVEVSDDCFRGFDLFGKIMTLRVPIVGHCTINLKGILYRYFILYVLHVRYRITVFNVEWGGIHPKFTSYKSVFSINCFRCFDLFEKIMDTHHRTLNFTNTRRELKIFNIEII
jgi:hypothetical protein